MSASICRSVSIQLPKTQQVLRDFIILDENFMQLDQSIGRRIDGLIGGRMFWGAVLDINYKKNVITLHNKRSFVPPVDRAFQKLPITIEDHKPYFFANLAMYKGGDIGVKLLLDTGSSLGVLYFLDTHESLQLPEKYVEGPLGTGLGGAVLGYKAKFKSLHLNNSLFFYNLVASYQVLDKYTDPETFNNRNGLIGNPLLSRFHIIIDYTDRQLYLKPVKKYNQGLEYDKSGLIVFAVGQNLNDFVVKYVIKGTPAHKAGIQVGDKIKGVGIVPAKLMSLGGINAKLNGKEGKKIKMKLLRGDQKIKKTFGLEDYLIVRSYIDIDPKSN